MTQNKILYGLELSKKLNTELKNEIATKGQVGKPKLATIILGEDEASKIYVANKIKEARKAGITTQCFELDSQTTQEKLLNIIHKLNADDSVHGILVQLPLPLAIDEKAILQAVDYRKDVDGFHPMNLGLLMLDHPYTIACTPKACLYLIERTKTPIKGANVVMIGKSNIVGKPLAQLLSNLGATVTACDIYTRNLVQIAKTADILIVAIGDPHFITKDYVKKNAVVIDVGINRLENKKLCGDVKFDEVVEKASFITPVPKGVGPLTISMLLQNTWDNFLRLQHGEKNHNL